RPGEVRRDPRADRAAVAARLRLTDALLQDGRRVHCVAQRPPVALHDGRWPAERAQPRSSRRALPAHGCRRTAAGSRARGRAHAHAARAARSDLMGGPDPALLSINTATVRAQWRLPQIIDALARHGIRGISPWRDQVADAGLKETAQRIRDHGLTVTGLCRGGMYPAADRQARRAVLDDNRRAVDEAAALEARCLVLVVGGLPKDREGRVVSKDLAGAREMVRDGIGELLDYARSAGMPLAIEPLHPMYAADRACINT